MNLSKRPPKSVLNYAKKNGYTVALIRYDHIYYWYDILKWRSGEIYDIYASFIPYPQIDYKWKIVTKSNCTFAKNIRVAVRQLQTILQPTDRIMTLINNDRITQTW